MVHRFWVLVVLVGCGGGGDPDGNGSDTSLGGGCTTEDITLAVGTGATAYEALADGDSVTMVHGPQGGWHVETAGLVANSEAEISILPALRSDSLGIEITGALQADYKALVGYDDTACSGTFYNTRAFIETDRDTGPAGLDFVCGLAGETVTFSVVVEDIVSLRQATAEVQVVLELDPADVPECP